MGWGWSELGREDLELIGIPVGLAYVNWGVTRPWFDHLLGTRERYQRSR
jgi:hypothetical protein